MTPASPRVWIRANGWSSMSRYAALMVSLSAATGCTLAPGNFPVSKDDEAQPTATAANFAYALAPTDDGRVFFSEKNGGRLRVIRSGALLDPAVAQVSVNRAGDGGLLGVALHPGFATNGRVYVFYSLSDTGENTSDPVAIIDHRVVYFDVVDNQAAGDEVFVASFPVGDSTTRIGGRIAFGADGKLYVAVGDQGNPDAAQDLASPSGKIHRLNDDGSIPDDNPFPGSTVFALGVRDVRGMTVDPVTGRLLVIDRNEGGNEEINDVLAGENLGWPAVVGAADSDAERAFAADTPSYGDPLYVRGNSAGLAGLAVNPSTRYGLASRNHLFFGEDAAARVTVARLDAARTGVRSTAPFTGSFPGGITDVAFTPAGTLYVATQTTVYRVAPIQ